MYRYIDICVCIHACKAVSKQLMCIAVSCLREQEVARRWDELPRVIVFMKIKTIWIWKMSRKMSRKMSK